MKPSNLTAQLLKILGLTGLGFAMVGLLISWFATPTMTVLIDRSYCPASQWQQVTQSYAQLYRQHQHRAIRIQSVVLFSDLAEDVRLQPPQPDELRQMSTYGRSNSQRQAQLQHRYSQPRLLTCFQSG